MRISRQAAVIMAVASQYQLQSLYLRHPSRELDLSKVEDRQVPVLSIKQ